LAHAFPVSFSPLWFFLPYYSPAHCNWHYIDNDFQKNPKSQAQKFITHPSLGNPFLPLLIDRRSIPEELRFYQILADR
jgi:hypothetical protein